MKEKKWDFRRMLLHLMVNVTPEQDAAGRYLESRGHEFLVDFGVTNAETKARQYFEFEPPVSRLVQ